jgi:hypothetical protein
LRRGEPSQVVAVRPGLEPAPILVESRVTPRLLGNSQGLAQLFVSSGCELRGFVEQGCDHGGFVRFGHWRVSMLAICRDPFGHLMRPQVAKISKAIFLGHVAI